MIFTEIGFFDDYGLLDRWENKPSSLYIIKYFINSKPSNLKNDRSLFKSKVWKILNYNDKQN